MQTKQFEDHRWENEDQVEVFRHIAAKEMVEGTSVLDLGSGDGFFLDKLKGKAEKLHGLDISDVGISKLREKGLTGEVFDFTNNDLPYKDGSFATVTILDVLEHLYFPENLLSEAVRVSSDAVVISVPNFSSLPARFQVLFGRVPENNRPKKGHCYWFNLASLKNVVKLSGGEIVELRTNTFWGQRMFLGKVTEFLNAKWPGVFGLSFVAKIKKKK